MGTLPSININKKVKNDWSYNVKLEARQLLREGDFNGPVNTDFDYVLTDISLITTKKVGLNSRIAGGYLIRLRGEEIIQRTIQQFTTVKRMVGFRLAHRFVSDQTFASAEGPEFRLRYRIGTEIPLNGEAVDPTEFYIKVNNEYLNSWQAKDFDLEIRLVPFLGYAISGNNKIELGLDYRIRSFLDTKTHQNFWVGINWFIEL